MSVIISLFPVIQAEVKIWQLVGLTLLPISLDVTMLLARIQRTHDKVELLKHEVSVQHQASEGLRNVILVHDAHLKRMEDKGQAEVKKPQKYSNADPGDTSIIVEDDTNIIGITNDGDVAGASKAPDLSVTRNCDGAQTMVKGTETHIAPNKNSLMEVYQQVDDGDGTWACMVKVGNKIRSGQNKVLSLN